MASINFNNFNVNSTTGQVTFSGVGSGINFQAIENSIIQAKQIPIDNLQTTITNNQKKITDLQKFQTLLQNFQSALQNMYGAVSADNSTNDFDITGVTTSSSRTDGKTPSPASSLLAVTTTNLASPGTHQIQVLQVALAEKIGSGTFNSQSTDLGTASGGPAGSISGDFTINGTDIAVLSTDNLPDLVSRINAADTGSNPTGVTASIVAISPTQNMLVLTADKTGTPITLGDPNNTGVLAKLGISNNGGSTLLNQLQAAQSAELTADGITDPSKLQSAVEASATAQLSTYTSINSAQSFQILDKNGNVLGTVNYSGTDTLNSLATKISAISGVTATVTQSGSGFQLNISSNAGTKISIGSDTGGIVGALGITNPQMVITRTSNTINDLFAGMTINLFNAEPGTTVNVSLTPNVTQIQSDITGFVQAYNAVRQFINTEHQTNSSTGQASSNSGPLFQDPLMETISAELSGIIGNGTTGVSSAFSSLAQIGITFVDNSTLTDPTLNDTLQIDTSTLNQALLNNLSDVQKLFAFNFSSSNPQVSLLGFTGSTTPSQSGYTLNLAYGSGSLTSANFNGASSGADNGSATVSGQTITATSATGANGLQLFYSGNTNLSNVQVNFTVGVAAQLFFVLQSATDPATGSIQNEINGIQTQDTQLQNNISQQQQLLSVYQQSLTQEFNNAETTISNLKDVQATVLQLLNSTSNNNNSGSGSSGG